MHDQWVEIPDAYRVSLSIEHCGMAVTVCSSAIYGRRLTIFYNDSCQPVLTLDGEVLATGTSTTPGTAQDMTLRVDHPYPAQAGAYCDAEATLTLTAGGCYFIINGWGHTGRWIIEKHHGMLQQVV